MEPVTLATHTALATSYMLGEPGRFSDTETEVNDCLDIDRSGQSSS